MEPIRVTVPVFTTRTGRILRLAPHLESLWIGFSFGRALLRRAITALLPPREAPARG